MTVSSDVRLIPEPLRLAVYGAGRWGQVLMRNIVAFPDLELAAVISSKPDLSDAMTLGAPVFDDWRLANSRMKLDGIVLALPPDRQPEIAEEIIEAGLPLFLEKPLALNNDAALRLVKVADASRVCRTRRSPSPAYAGISGTYPTGSSSRHCRCYQGHIRKSGTRTGVMAGVVGLGPA